MRAPVIISLEYLLMSISLSWGIYTVPAGIPLHMHESIIAIEDLALIQSHSDTRIMRGVITADPIRLETQCTLNSLQVGFNYG